MELEIARREKEFGTGFCSRINSRLGVKPDSGVEMEGLESISPELRNESKRRRKVRKVKSWS